LDTKSPVRLEPWVHGKCLTPTVPESYMGHFEALLGGELLDCTTLRGDVFFVELIYTKRKHKSDEKIIKIIFEVFGESVWNIQNTSV